MIPMTLSVKSAREKAIEGSLKDNAKLYDLLEKYDKKVKAQDS